MKKFLALILAVTMGVGLVSTSYANVDDDPLAGVTKNEAKVVFTSDGFVKTDNITTFRYSGSTEYMNGEYVLRRDHATEEGRHIQVVTDNDWLYAPDGTPVEIEVEYFDKGNGFMAIRYNGVGDKLWWEGFSEIWSETEQLFMTDTGKYKTYTYYIEDMKAMQEFEGLDMQFSLWTHQYGVSPGDIYLKSITIRKVLPKEPLKLTTESVSVGNNFGPGEDKTIKAVFTNITEYAFKTEATYKVCDYHTNKVLEEGSFSLDNEARGAVEHIFDMNKYTRFGVYRIYVNMKHTIDHDGEMVEINNEIPIGFSIINKAETHERNPVINVNIHTATEREKHAALAGYAGFGGTRNSIYWFGADPEADGTYVISEEHRDQIRVENENNLNRLLLATYGPTGYLDHEPYDVYHVPTSEKAHKAYGEYINYMLDNEPSIDYVSLWNEPSHHGFEVNPPENYAKMISVAYPMVKEKHPDVPLIGIGSAQCDLDLIEAVLKAGGGEYMDAVTFHPYDWSGGTYNMKWLERCIEDVNNLFIKYTGKKKPIWLDELGMHTGGSLGGSNPTANYAEDEQGASYIKIFAVVRSKQLVEKMFYYDLNDDGNDDSYSEHRFGLTKSRLEIPSIRFSAKPGYVQIAGLNKLMWDAEGIECIEPEEGLWLCNFKKPNGENIAICWTEVGSECNVSLNLGDNEIEVLDMYTNSLGKMTSDDGVHTIGLTRHPLYIKGNFQNFEAEKTNEGIALNYVATPDDAFEMVYNTNKAGNFRAECDDAKNFVPSEMVNSKIPFTTTVEAEGKSYSNVRIYNNDKLVYIAQPEIVVEEAFMIDVESRQISENDANHWHMATTIQNSSNTRAINGTCRIIEINGKAVENKPQIFENLKPGEKITLYLNLDEMIKKRNVNLKVETKLDNGYSRIVAKELDFTTATYAAEKPKIDGVIETGEWKGVWLTADTEDRADFANGSWDGPDDLSINSNLMWDDKYLYFGAIAVDDHHFNDKTPGELWAGDSIQFGIENRVYQGDFRIGMGGTGGNNYTEIGIGLLNGTPGIYRWLAQDGVNPTGEVPNCDLAIGRKGNKTYYELAIPWTELIAQDYVLDETTIFGFSMLINENDGAGRDGWLEYNAGIGRLKNTLMFGKMNLVK